MQKRDIHDFLSEMSVSNFSDRSIRRLLENKENVRGLLEIVAAELAALIDFEHLVVSVLERSLPMFNQLNTRHIWVQRKRLSTQLPKY